MELSKAPFRVEMDNGVFLGEDATSFRIKTDRGEELVQPKLFSTLEWLSEARA